jgi:S-adenosylmethionine hydrolase
MPLITLLSDFGYKDHYVAAVKVAILKVMPQARVIDISHGIEPYDIAQGAFTLGAVFRDFPPGTIHLIAVDTHGSKQHRFIAAKLEGHFFIGSDNGLISLLSDKEPDEIVELPLPPHTGQVFPLNNVFVEAAARLRGGENLADIGTPTQEMKRLLNRQLRLTDHRITGHVMDVDHYGNLITNISRDAIDGIGHGRRFLIKFGRETVNQLNSRYSEMEAGDCVCLINDRGMLEIAIVKGHAAELLGLRYDSQIDIEFFPQNAEDES